MGAVAVVVAACGGSDTDTAPPSITITTVDSLVDSAPPPLTESTYDAALGSVLVVPVFVDGTPGSSGSPVAILSPRLLPETPVSDTVGLRERLADGRIELFARSGFVEERTIVWTDDVPVGPEVCASWPTGVLGSPAVSTPPVGAAPGSAPAEAPGVGASPGTGARRWLVGLPSGRARGLPLDSIEVMPSRDSAAFAATLSRLASGLPEDSSSAFRGLPFTVVRAYRTVDRTAAGFVVAVLVRRIPQEDRPMEERLLLVVDTPSDNVRQWDVSWHERTEGREEEVIATEPLAALSVTTTPPYTAIILGRDDGSGTALAVLERRNGRWRVRWESPVTGC
jgi:hypothetical protein